MLTADVDIKNYVSKVYFEIWENGVARECVGLFQEDGEGNAYALMPSLSIANRAVFKLDRSVLEWRSQGSLPYLVSTQPIILTSAA